MNEALIRLSTDKLHRALTKGVKLPPGYKVTDIMTDNLIEDLVIIFIEGDDIPSLGSELPELEYYETPNGYFVRRYKDEVEE